MHNIIPIILCTFYVSLRIEYQFNFVFPRRLTKSYCACTTSNTANRRVRIIFHNINTMCNPKRNGNNNIMLRRRDPNSEIFDEISVYYIKHP
jgi:hypothetical protein